MFFSKKKKKKTKLEKLGKLLSNLSDNKYEAAADRFYNEVKKASAANTFPAGPAGKVCKELLKLIHIALEDKNFESYVFFRERYEKTFSQTLKVKSGQVATIDKLKKIKQDTSVSWKKVLLMWEEAHKQDKKQVAIDDLKKL